MVPVKSQLRRIVCRRLEGVDKKQNDSFHGLVCDRPSEAYHTRIRQIWAHLTGRLPAYRGRSVNRANVPGPARPVKPRNLFLHRTRIR